MKTMRVWIAATLSLAAMTGCDGKKSTAQSPDKNNGSAQVQQPQQPDEQFVAGQKTDRFTVAMAADPETFDTAKMSGAPEGQLAFNLFEGLMMPGPTTEGLTDTSKLVVYGVAESHTVSEDGKTYTFKLRADAKWSTGDALTSADFVYSWRRVLTPGFPADYAQMLWVIQGAEAFNKGAVTDWEQVGIKAPDAQTLVVTLNEPTPYFLELLAFYTFFPVPEKAIAANAEEWSKPENIVTNGAYKLTSYKPQQEILLEKSDQYWDKANVGIDKVRFQIISDQNAIVNAYKTGALHWTGPGLPVAQITNLLTHPDYMSEPMLGVYYYRVNVSKQDSPLFKPQVRRALAAAIDRESLVNNTMNGLFKAAPAFVPDSMAGYTSTTKVGYDAVAAKQLLADAGYPGGQGMPAIELLYNTDQNHKLVAESVQQMWKNTLGIDVKLVNKEWKTYLQDIDTQSYQVARAGWIGDYNDPMTFLDMWVTDNGNNDTGWSNADYDKLIASARQEADVAKRLVLLQQAEALLLEQGPVIPIYFYTNNMLVTGRLKGFEPHNRDVHLLKYMTLN
jgi:oligopeptide transport system substrate-binding protein